MFLKKYTNKTTSKQIELNNKISFRNEKKILFFENEQFIIKFLKVNGFKEIFKERLVNSIYFDDYNLTNLLETIDGEKYRSKIRLRLYCKIKDINNNPNLEEKIKVNTKNYKIFYPIKLKKVKNKINIKEIHNEIQGQLNKNKFISLKIKNTLPTSFVSYQRSYFAKSKLRVTIDKDLKFKKFIGDRYLSGNENFEKKKFLILEFKFNDESYDLIKFLSSQIPNRFTKFSKYEFSLTN